MHAYEISIYWAVVIACVLLLVIVILFAWALARSKSQLLKQTQASYRAELELLEERNRLAADLHDEVGPLLKEALSLTRTIGREAPAAAEATARLRMHLQQVADCSRRIAHNLLPPSILLKGVGGALEELLLECRAFHRFDTESMIAVQEEPSASTAMHVYRMVQEMISNAVKHSGGNLVQLQLVQERRQVVLRFQDNGKGYEPEAVRDKGLGLRSLQLRAVLLGARLRCLSNAQGTLYSLHIPLRKWRTSVLS